jgi:hypothetical protein
MQPGTTNQLCIPLASGWASALTSKMPCNQHGRIILGTLPVQAKCAHWHNTTHRISPHTLCGTRTCSVHQHRLCRSLCCSNTLSHHCTPASLPATTPIGSASPYPPPHTILPLGMICHARLSRPGTCTSCTGLRRVAVLPRAF